MKNLAEIRANIAYNAILVAILIVYGLLGAWVFRKLEAVNSSSITNDHQLKDAKEKLLKELWDQNRLEFDQWSTQARKRLDSYEKNFMVELSNTAEWSWDDSWLFACTIFTTIGDGNIVPVSMSGRIFCVMYGFLGIPLFNVVASSLVSLITGVLRFLHSANLRRRRQREAEKLKKDEDSSELQTVLAVMCLGICPTRCLVGTLLWVLSWLSCYLVPWRKRLCNLWTKSRKWLDLLKIQKRIRKTADKSLRRRLCDSIFVLSSSPSRACST